MTVDEARATANVNRITTPILILVGTADSLLPVNHQLHDRLEKAGKKVRMEVYQNGYHGFVMGPMGVARPDLKDGAPLLDITLQAMESALRHVVGGAAMDQVITEGREQIAVDVQQRLQQYLDHYKTGILVAKVNIEEAHAPAQVQEAFDDVTRAKEDRERLKNEAEAYANSIIPEARGRAQRALEEAAGYREQVIARAQGEAARFDDLLVEYRKAPEVTRNRLYIESIQAVLGNSSKVMVDVEGGNNLLYLPLDRMMQGSSAAAGSASDGDVPLLGEQMQSLRGESRIRGREGR